jgi:hypothetical protein
MAAITLKNVSDKLLSKLRKTAAANRRSLNQQALLMLAEASERASPSRAVESSAAAAQLDEWRALCGAWRSDGSAKVELARIHRQRSAGRKVEL